MRGWKGYMLAILAIVYTTTAPAVYSGTNHPYVELLIGYVKFMVPYLDDDMMAFHTSSSMKGDKMSYSCCKYNYKM